MNLTPQQKGSTTYAEKHINPFYKIFLGIHNPYFAETLAHAPQIILDYNDGNGLEHLSEQGLEASNKLLEEIGRDCRGKLVLKKTSSSGLCLKAFYSFRYN